MEMTQFTLQDFSIPEPSPDEAELPRHSAAEIEAARAQAWAEGHEEGLAEGYRRGHEAAMEAVDADIARAQTAVSASLASLAEDLQGLSQQMEAEATATLRSLIQAMLPAVVQAAYREGLVELCRQAVQAALGSRSLQITVPEALVETCSARVRQLAREAGYKGAVEISGDPELGPMQAHAGWDSGGATLDLDAFSASVRELLEVRDSKADQ